MIWLPNLDLPAKAAYRLGVPVFAVTGPDPARYKWRMKQRSGLWLIVGAGVVGGASVIYLLGPREPVYHGKPIRSWFDAYETHRPPAFREAQTAFHQIGSNAVPFLVTKLRTHDSLINRLYRSHWPRLPAVLQKRLPAPRSPSQDGFEAVALLAQLGPAARPAVPDLLRILKGDFPFGSLLPPGSITAAYRRLGPPLGFDPQEMFLRGNAASTLATCDPDNPEVFFALFKALRDPSIAGFFVQAVWMLNSGRPARPITSEQTAYLLDFLNDASDWAREAAAATLVRAPATHYDQVVPALVHRLADASQRVQMAASQTLAGLGHHSDLVVQALADALSSPDLQMQFYAAQTLADIGPPAKAAVPALNRLLNSEHHEIQYRAAMALWKVDGQAEPLIPFRIEEVRGSTVGGDVAGADAAIRRKWGWAIQRDPETVRWEAARFLGDCGKQAKAAVPALIGMLQDSNDRLRAAAAEALGRIGPGAQAAGPALTQAMQDQWMNVREAAGVALKLVNREAHVKTGAP